MIDLGLNSARAIVVGAGFIPERAGHGRGTALRLAAAGATVACVDIDAGRAAAIAAEVEDAGGKAVAIVGDVTVSTGRRSASSTSRSPRSAGSMSASTSSARRRSAART